MSLTNEAIERIALSLIEALHKFLVQIGWEPSRREASTTERSRPSRRQAPCQGPTVCAGRLNAISEAFFALFRCRLEFDGGLESEMPEDPSGDRASSVRHRGRVRGRLRSIQTDSGQFPAIVSSALSGPRLALFEASLPAVRAFFTRRREPRRCCSTPGNF